MKYIIYAIALTAIAGCATSNTSSQKPYTLLPWECASSVEPQDAIVIRKVGNLYVYDCLWNGNGASDGNGDGDGEGSE